MYSRTGGASIRPGLIFPANVAGDDLERIEFGVELAGDAVEEADGAADEEQPGREVANARAEPAAEIPDAGLRRLVAE